MKFRLFALAVLILTQCGWSWGWQQALTPNYIIYPGITAATNYTLSNAQSGNIIIFNGSSDNTKFTLPAATLGLDFTVELVCQTAGQWSIKNKVGTWAKDNS